MKKYGGFLGVFVVWVLCCFFVVFAPIMKIATSNSCGFGADSNGNVYIGRFHQIEVYRNKQCVNIINLPEFRSWFFTVSSDDTILVSNYENQYIYDLTGKLLMESPDNRGKIFHYLKDLRECTNAQSQTYTMTRFMGWVSIADSQGEIVYTSPFLDILHSFAFGTVFLLFLIFFPKLKTGKKTGDGSVVS